MIEYGCVHTVCDISAKANKAIEEIRNAQNNIPDARRIMCKKYHIGSTTYQKIIDNRRPPEPTEEWHRIIESVIISDQISGGAPQNNQESSYDTPSSIIQEDGITYIEYPIDNENDVNSNSLNTVTSGQKDKVGRKKKTSIKPKDKSSSDISFKDDTSKWEFDLKKLINITR